MNEKRMFIAAAALILAVAMLAGITSGGMAQASQGTDRGGKAGRLDFTTVLHGGEPAKFILGPCARLGGYVVDITPLRDSEDGAYIEKSILPEFIGDRWVDVLTLLLPSDVPPLKVHVQVYSTASWPVVFQSTLNLNPGAWHGFRVQESSVAGGYVIEINPRGTAQPGDRVERALVQPEFPADGYWCDVLRLMIPVEQQAMEAEVIVYQTPAGLPVVAEYELDAEAGVWYGLGIGDSQAGGAYVVEVTPLVNELSQIERYTIQPEFDGQNWNDVVRVMVSPEWPTMPLRVTVYLAGGG